MRVLQLIDSLDAGGAERMAVNYANALCGKVVFSGLVVTRKEGVLKEQLHVGVPYFFLNRKKRLDVGAVLRLRRFVREHDVMIVHAHGTSFFIAVLLKLLYPKVKLVWHDHNGNRNSQTRKENTVLRLSSRYFDCIFAVNQSIQVWCELNLHCSKVLYVPNFTVADTKSEGKTFLKGVSGKKIVCLSNLRYPKNHLFLLAAFYGSGLANTGWTLHFIGKDYNDLYSKEVKDYISSHGLESSVYLYGSCTDVYFILGQAAIGVLASTHEGFPVALLEYGLSKLAVLSTDVGYCKEIIRHEENGLLFDPADGLALQNALLELGGSGALRTALGEALYQNVFDAFSAQTVTDEVVSYYVSL